MVGEIILISSPPYMALSDSPISTKMFNAYISADQPITRSELYQALGLNMYLGFRTNISKNWGFGASLGYGLPGYTILAEGIFRPYSSEYVGVSLYLRPYITILSDIITGNSFGFQMVAIGGLRYVFGTYRFDFQRLEAETEILGIRISIKNNIIMPISFGIYGYIPIAELGDYASEIPVIKDFTDFPFTKYLSINLGLDYGYIMAMGNYPYRYHDIKLSLSAVWEFGKGLRR